jgi:hypothetical protein
MNGELSNKPDTSAFRDMAAALKARTGFNATMIKYVKGRWKMGRNEIDINDTQLVARVDWTMVGWTKWWDKRAADFKLGYVADRFIPPARKDLGHLDEEQWFGSNGRDPWSLQWHLPLVNAVSNEQFIWSTNSQGGKDAISALLAAYADHVDAGEKATLPIVALATSSYPHPEFSIVHTPQLDIIGWVEPPATQRPALPIVAMPQLLPASAPTEKKPELAELDDEIPF